MIPLLVAHRGYWEQYPENSLAGIDAALRAGACLVEFDVQLSADGVPVLLHDASLLRTAGVDVDVFALSAAELASISVHEPQRMGQAFRPAPVPTLAQVLELLESCPAATAIIEIKQQSLDVFGIEHTMDILLETIRPFTKRNVVIAYNADALAYARSREPVRTGWVLTAFDAAHRQRALELDPDYLVCNHDKLAANEILWPGEWVWMLYDINDADTALALAARGAALIETRDIGRMLRHPQLRRRACHADAKHD